MATLKIRRGLEANRAAFTPAEGEVLCASDTRVLYLGDGVTAGGNIVRADAITFNGQAPSAFATAAQGTKANTAHGWGNHATAGYQTISGMPSALSDFTNDAGFITNYTVTQADVKAHQAALSLTASQISGMPDALSDFTNDVGFISGYTVTQSDVTTHQAALTITKSQISDLETYSVEDIDGLQTSLDAKLDLAGGTMTGALNLTASASGGAGLNLGVGVAPTAPVNGDMWVTASNIMARVNGTNRTLAYTNSWSTVTVAEAEAGTATTVRQWTAQRVKQAIVALSPVKADGTGAAGTWGISITGNAVSATTLAVARTIGMTGDVTWTSTGFDGSGNVTGTATLANSGVGAGTYNNSATQVRPFTVDAKGRITGIGTAVTIAPAFSNVTGKPTTLSGYGITDGQPLDADLTAIAALSGTAGILRKTASNTWELDTNTGTWSAVTQAEAEAGTATALRLWSPLRVKQAIASLSPGSTDAVPEGSSNLYHTAARVGSAVLTGLSLASNAAVTAADTVLEAIGKLQKQISDNEGGGAGAGGPAPFVDLGDVAVSGSETVTLDLSASDFFLMSLQNSGIAGTLTLDFDLPDLTGMRLSWHVRIQRGGRKSGGLAFSQTVQWSGGVTPPLNGTTNSWDLLMFYKVGNAPIRVMLVDYG